MGKENPGIRMSSQIQNSLILYKAMKVNLQGSLLYWQVTIRISIRQKSHRFFNLLQVNSNFTESRLLSEVKSNSNKSTFL